VSGRESSETLCTQWLFSEKRKFLHCDEVRQQNKTKKRLSFRAVFSFKKHDHLPRQARDEHTRKEN
jgi:hypothetical protein